MKELIDQMKSNARAYNKYLTFEGMSVSVLLLNTHPIDRNDFLRKLLKLNKI